MAIGATPSEAKRRVKSKEFALYKAYFEHEPFGQFALFNQLAHLAAQFLKADEKFDVEELVYCPYQYRQRNPTIEDLEDEEDEECDLDDDDVDRPTPPSRKRKAKDAGDMDDEE